jgi:hypothetical protein
VMVNEDIGTYTRPRLRRIIKLILMRIFKLRFQKMRVGNTARNRSQAEFAAVTCQHRFIESEMETYC